MPLRFAVPLSVLVTALWCLPARARNDTLKVATFNILKGGVSAGQPLSRTCDVIVASGADVAGIQESDGSGAALAQLLGWNYRVFSFDRGTESGNTDCAIVSRLPITQTLRNGARVQLAAGKEA